MLAIALQRFLRVLLSSLLPGVLFAQGALTTTFANNNAGNTGGAVYFDLQVATTITTTGFQVNVHNTPGTAGSIEIWMKNGTRSGFQTNAALWTLAGTGTCVSNGGGVPSTVAITPTVLVPGAYGFALRGVNLGFAYTNGNGSNQIYATAELTALLGEATNVPFTAPVISPRVANFSLQYVVGSQPLVANECAGATLVGLGTTQTMSNVGYTTSLPQMCTTGGADRWFKFVAQTTGTYHFHTCQSGAAAVDTVLEVLAGNCGSLTSLGCNDDSCGLLSRVSATLAANQQVYVRVGGYTATTGTFQLSIDRVVADFTATPTSGLAPLAVNFTNLSTTTALGGLTSFAWDLDGDTVVDSYAAAPQFTYATGGTYTVTLTVQDAVNPPLSITKSNYIQVTNPVLPGDECATAADVFVGNNGQFTNVGYTPSNVSNACGVWGAADKDRWFRFVPTYQYSYRFTVANASMSARLEVRNGACGSQTSLGCGSEVMLPNLNAGTAYFVRVAGTGGSTGTFTLRIRPADDECSGATPIAVGSTVTQRGDDYSASAATICGATTFLDRWFVFTPPFSAPWTFAAHATSVLEVWPSCGSGQFACGTGTTTTSSLSGGVPVLLRLGMSGPAPNPTVLITPGKGTGTAVADVVFNEVCYDGPSPGQEFIELHNTTAFGKPIDQWYVVAVTANAQTTVLLAPQGTTIPAHGVWHAGLGSSTALLLSLPDDATSLRLHDHTGALVDTLAYEAVAGTLAPQFLQGHALFGEHRRTLDTSWGRNRDGHVTDTGAGSASDNGFEWRIGAATRGLSNNLPETGYVQTSYENITSAPEWGGCQVAPNIVTPAPASLDGGQCLEFAAPTPPGGRSWFYKASAEDNYQLDAWVWLDLPTLPTGGYCVWSLGLCGTTDSEYQAATPWRTRPDLNGDTGISWVYEVVPGPGGLPTGSLSLIDNGAGGKDHVVLWHETITAANDGWRRLGLGVAPKSLLARIDGNVGSVDGLELERPHDHAHGGIYVGIRQSHNVGFKLRIDGAIVDRSWNNHDTTGSGCDGNCPPRNGSGGVLKRTVPPEAKTYALHLPNSATFTATQFCFYMAATSQSQSVPPFVQLCAAVGTGTAAVPGAVLRASFMRPEDPRDSQAWWIMDSFGPALTHGADLFLKITLPATIQPPILQERTDSGQLQMVDYLTWTGTTWGPWAQAPFAFKWTCAGDSSAIDADADNDDSLDISTIDFKVTFPLAAPTPVFLVIGTSALALPLDGLGAPTCKLYTDLASVSAFVATGGAQTASFIIPNAAPLVGVSLHSQWAVLNPAWNPLGLRTSDRRTITIRSP